MRLERILGLGGEGIVLSEKMTTKEYHYETLWEKKRRREVAVKFVKFEKDDNEDFEEPEEKERRYNNYGYVIFKLHVF